MLLLLFTGSAADPSPNDYNREKSETITLKAAPSYSHGLRRGGTYLWASGGQIGASIGLGFFFLGGGGGALYIVERGRGEL